MGIVEVIRERQIKVLREEYIEQGKAEGKADEKKQKLKQNL